MEYLRCLDCGAWYVVNQWKYGTPTDVTEVHYDYCPDCAKHIPDRPEN